MDEFKTRKRILENEKTSKADEPTRIPITISQPENRPPQNRRPENRAVITPPRRSRQRVRQPQPPRPMNKRKLRSLCRMKRMICVPVLTAFRSSLWMNPAEVFRKQRNWFR